MDALTLMLLLLQAPGDGWAVAEVRAREVKTIYWDLFGTSETWVTIIPTDPKGGQPLVRLVFQAFFAGKDAKGTPTRIVVRAVGLPLTMVSAYSLRLVIDKNAIDLGTSCMAPDASAPPCQLLYPGDGCAATGVAVDVQGSLLERLAAAHTVAGTALGLPIILSAEDRAAVAGFADAIHVKAASQR